MIEAKVAIKVGFSKETIIGYERVKLEKANGRQRDDLERESLYRKKTEAQWKQMAEDYDKKVGCHMLIYLLYF